MNCADPRRGPTHYARIGLGVSNELLKSMEGRKCFTGIAGCCALAASGHAAAAPPSSVMELRRLLIRSPRRRGREATPLELLEKVQVVAVRILQTDHAGAPGLILRRPFKFHASCA